MADIVKLCRTTQNSTFFIVYSDNTGTLRCVSYMGDPTSLKDRLEEIIDQPIVITGVLSHTILQYGLTLG